MKFEDEMEKFDGMAALLKKYGITAAEIEIEAIIVFKKHAQAGYRVAPLKPQTTWLAAIANLVERKRRGNI